MKRNSGQLSNVCFHVSSYPALRRDNEDAYVSVNDKICWKKTGIVGNSGKQLCGATGKYYREKVFPVKNCHVELSGAPEESVPLTVRLWTNLDGKTDQKSFGIDNVAITKLEEEGNARGIRGWVLLWFTFLRICEIPAHKQTYHSLARKHIQAHGYTYANSHVNMDIYVYNTFVLSWMQTN